MDADQSVLQISLVVKCMHKAPTRKEEGEVVVAWNHVTITKGCAGRRKAESGKRKEPLFQGHLRKVGVMRLGMSLAGA